MNGEYRSRKGLWPGPPALLALGWLCSGCGNTPSDPTPPASVTIQAVTPAPGSTVVIPRDYVFYVPGGVVLPRGSGLVSVDVSLRSAAPVSWAQLSIYLLTGGQSSTYCGQNAPDAPTWGQLPQGWTTRYTVTGFRVSSLPCDVTGVRVMLHTRNNGLLTPPSPSETIAEATYPVSFRIQQ